jgi:hypothetical protein
MNEATPLQLNRLDTDRMRGYKELLDFYHGQQWEGKERRGERRLIFNYARVFVEKVTKADSPDFVPPAQRIAQVLVVIPEELIALKVIAYHTRRGQPKSGTDWRDLAMLLLTFPELKHESGLVDLQAAHARGLTAQSQGAAHIEVSASRQASTLM